MAETSDVACSLSSLLEQAQYNAKLIQTKTVAETRETLESLDADIVFLAHHVADGGGLSFARSLNTDLRTSALSVVILAEHDARDDAIDALRSGASDCIAVNSVQQEEFGQAIENALRRRSNNPADHLAVISNLEAENATLRRIALRNMRLLKTETLPLLAFAWQAIKEKSHEVTEGRRLAQRLSRISRTVLGLIDDTVITSTTHRALDVPGPVDLHSVANRIIADDCGEIRLSSAHFKLHELPVLMVRESILSMLLEELFVSLVRHARFGNVPEIEVGTSKDPNGNPVIWLTDSGVPLSARKQALSQRFAGLNDLGSPRHDALSWSLCQRLAEKCGGEFKISESATEQIRISLRFPIDLVVPPKPD